MPSLNFNYQHLLFEKTIQLYGDRTGGQGNFEFAGFAKLHEIKVVLLHGNAQSLEQPSDWRRFLRLTDLAQRLNKPIVLWNLPLIRSATIQHPASLALATAIQNTKLQLLKLTEPIITVFDETYEWSAAIQEIGWMGGYVILKPEKEEFPTLSGLKRQNLKFVGEQTDIPKQILELLHEISQISREELVANRLKSFHLPTENQR